MPQLNEFSWLFNSLLFALLLMIFMIPLNSFMMFSLDSSKCIFMNFFNFFY